MPGVDGALLDPLDLVRTAAYDAKAAELAAMFTEQAPLRVGRRARGRRRLAGRAPRSPIQRPGGFGALAGS